MSELPRSDHAGTAPAHETSDVKIRPLAIFLAWLAVLLIVAGGFCAWLFSLLEHGAERKDGAPPPLAEGQRPTPGPLLQVSERHDLEALRAREEQQLHAVAWVDKERGIARIPIDQAMTLLVEHGLPKWPAAPPATNSAKGSGQTTPVPKEGPQ